MRKALMIVAVAVFVSMPAFAAYWVVLKDGTKYHAKTKWTVVNGKAVIPLMNGSTIAVDLASIDMAKSEETTRLGGGKMIAMDQEEAPMKSQSSLGTAIKLRKLQQQQAAAAATETTATAPPSASNLSNEVIDKFARAYENVGIYEQKVTSPAPFSLRVELTADSEDKVFNAISATSFLISKNAGVPGTQIDVVELFMKTTTGGAAGRFQMTREDAKALETKQIAREDYFVRKVIY